MSLNQWISVAVAEKVGVVETAAEFFKKRAGDASGPGLMKSIGFFTQALDIDPTFALAYSGMADAYVQLGYGNALSPGDAFPKARATSSR